jgi:F-type H+-transporting ATPase subunit epsilon
VTLRLEILVPDAVVLDTRVTGVLAADATGRFGLRPGHERFVTVLAPSLLVYTDRAGTERFAAVDGGVLVLEGDRVSVVTREAVLADRLEDLAERAAAILDVRQRLERKARIEFEELQTALVKQLARLGRPS